MGVKELIKRLCEATGPSGDEDQVRNVIASELNARAGEHTLELYTDQLGNLVAHKKGPGDGRKIMLAAHMDEIGLVASYVDKKGYIRFGSVGGVDVLNLRGSRVRFTDGTGGVVGMEKLDEPSKVPNLDKLYIDVGAHDRESCRVQIGAAACFVRPFEDFGGRLVAKAMDDRIGCAVLIELASELKHSIHDLYYVFTVQEEVGLRGATTSSYGVDPQLALAVDVTGTGDTPEAPPMAVSLGSGPAIKVKDAGMLAHPGVKTWLVETAEANDIAFQLEVLTGGTTDARAIQTSRAGVPSGCVSIPCRYVHTPSEMVDYADVEGALRLLVAALSGPLKGL